MDICISKQVEAEIVKMETLLAEEFAGQSEEFDALVLPLMQAGGKRIRARLFLLISLLGNSRETDRIRVAAAIEILHLATLVHDDVLDQSALRRGKKTIHSLHGNKVAILSGDFLFAKAFGLLASLGNTALLGIFSRTIESLVEGEFLQMQDLYDVRQGTDKYLLKTRRKTADFIEACMELGAVLGGLNESYTTGLKKFGHILGMAFQVSDDMIDYLSTEGIAGKPICNDIRSGVLTYPLLVTVTEENAKALQEEVYKVKAGKSADTLLAYLESHKGLEKTFALMEDYERKGKEILSVLPVSEVKDVLETLLLSLCYRKV